MKVPPMGAELFQVGGRTDRQTDEIKLISTFDNLANVPKETLAQLTTDLSAGRT
jgi:hypothetical protein